MKWYYTVPTAAAVVLATACVDRPPTSPEIARPNLIVAGAGFTTTNPHNDGVDKCLNGPSGLTTPSVNCNIYDTKANVWINGGPNHTGPSALSDGDYFFAVLEPGGQPDPNDGAAKNLSDETEDDRPSPGSGTGDLYTDRMFRVSGGEITENLGTHLDDDFFDATHGLLIRLVPYDDTRNPGGVYILALCKLNAPEQLPVYPVNPDDCKYDAFKVRNGETPPPEFGRISGLKYYDSNRNGQWDAGEVGIKDWPIDFNDAVAGTLFTVNNGTFTSQFDEDTYTFQEQLANAPWVQTGNTVLQTKNNGVDVAGPKVTLTNKVYTIILEDEDDITGVNFGNVCEVYNRNGFTLGYWSNKNGQAVLRDNDDAWRTLLTNLNLVQGITGLPFNIAPLPTSFNNAYGPFNTWLLNATATNMSYMLSVQMAATVLDINYKGLDGTALVLDPDGNWTAINQVIIDANTFLGSHPVTVISGADRTRAERYKNIFDRLNNNIQIVTPPTLPT